ncbi:MAG TPA: hypothetical protein VGM00_03765 [Bradyrhizobium sp.]|jgi:hypothetical protein
MPDTYIIEVGSQPAGIVVRNPKGFRFFAASQRFHRMEGQLFRNAREAERAAFQIEKSRIAPVIAMMTRVRSVPP